MSEKANQSRSRSSGANRTRPPVPESRFLSFFGAVDGELHRDVPEPGHSELGRLLEQLIGRPLQKGNSIRELVNGDRFFPVMLKLIRGAQRSITMETFLWQSGEISDRFVEALSERARSGVNVHVMGDGIGFIKMKQADIERMKDSGIHVVLYERARRTRIKANLNHRTHRKTLVVDGLHAVVGGVCITDEWLGDATSRSHWRDNGYLIRGPMVNQVQAVFVQNWVQTTAQVLWGEDYFPEIPPAGRVRGHFYETRPGARYGSVRISFFLAISAAQKNIRITHGYFVPDDEAIRLLIEARKRSVGVEVILPDINDNVFERAASRSRWPPLLEHGVEIYTYQPAMLHCKCLIADEVLICAGSSNFDPRSFTSNDESDFNVIDRDFVRRQIEVFEEDKRHSELQTKEMYYGRPLSIKAADTVMGRLWKLF